MTAAEKIKEMGIVPVVVLEDEKDAGALAKALCEGGLPCAEVTFRTAAAKESIRIMLTPCEISAARLYADEHRLSGRIIRYRRCIL